MRNCFVMTLLACAWLGETASAAAFPTTLCRIDAYAINADDSGTNVRAAPDARSRLLAVLAPDLNASVSITGAKGDWLRVASAEANGVEADRTLFRGVGWIHASMLTLGIAAADLRLYASPSRNSRVLRRLQGGDPGVTLAGCKGDWAKVRIDGLAGWLSPAGQCSNPLTTCP